MPSQILGLEYDVFISYRQKDNEYDGWVTEFVANLKKELRATFKDEVSVYFDGNPVDGLLESHQVDESLEGKLRCAILIPIISQTYCDPKSFAWTNEFLVFKKRASEDSFGLKIKLGSGNVALRVLPVRIHELDSRDQGLIEAELGPLRAIDFIFTAPGVNRPLTPNDSQEMNLNRTLYRDQINKVANGVKELLDAMQEETGQLPVTAGHSTTGTKKKGSATVIAGLLILIALSAAYLMKDSLFSKIAVAGNKTIAVLAFEDLSPEQNQEWFSDGISEEIINSLANLKDLQVTARTSSFYFKGKSIPLKEIAEILNVEYVVEGSVRRVNDQFRVVVQLIDAANGFHVLSQTYDRPAKDILQIQSDIARDISEKLVHQLTPGQYASMNEDRTKNSEAYELYLRAKKQHSTYQMDHTENRDKSFYLAENLFLKAINQDPDYASAYGALADLYDSRGNVTDRLRLWRLRDSLARKAFNINPHSIDALVACYLIYAKPNASPVLPDSAFWYLKQAYLNNPNDSEVLRLLGLFCSRSMLPVEGVRFTNRALELDPLNFFARQQLANYDFCLGQLDRAEVELSKLVEMDSMRIPVRQSLGMVYALKGNLGRANLELSFCERYFPGRNVDLRDLIRAAGSDKRSVTQSKDILVLATLGLKDEVYQQLDSCVGLKWNSLRGPLFSAAALEHNQAFDFLRNDDRFKALLDRARIDQIEKGKKFRLD